MGIKLFILVLSYNLLIPLVGLFRKNSDWIKLWIFVFLISLFQIFPDWFLSAQLNILVFPEDGFFKIAYGECQIDTPGNSAYFNSCKKSHTRIYPYIYVIFEKLPLLQLLLKDLFNLL